MVAGANCLHYIAPVASDKQSWIATVFNFLSLANIEDVNLRSCEEINRRTTLKQIKLPENRFMKQDS